MNVGDLVFICPGDPTLGVVIAPDVDFPNTCIGDAEQTYSRTKVLFDDNIYSVPTFQLEVINESR